MEIFTTLARLSGFHFQDAPRFVDPEARQRFRSYPSRAVVAPPDANGETWIWLVDVAPPPEKGFWRNPLGTIRTWIEERDRGTLLKIRLRDGHIAERIPLRGRGLRYVLPLLYEGRLFIPSSKFLEIYHLDPAA